MKFILKSILIFLSCVGYFGVNAQSWDVTEMSNLPEPISNNAVVGAMVNDTPYVYSFSGIDSTKIFSGISLKSFRYNTISDEWERIADLPDTLGKIAAGASVVKNKIYIIGGYHVASNGSEVSSNKVHRYDPQSNSYLSDGTPIPVPIDDQVQCVWRDSLIFVVTGWSNTTNVADVQIYDPSLDSWSAGTPVHNNDIYKSFGSSGVIKGDTLYYLGGASSNGAANFPIQNSIRVGIINPLNPLQITWREANHSNPPFIAYGYRMAATVAFDYVHWIGGSNQTYNFNGLAYANGLGVPPNNRNLIWWTFPRLFFEDTSTTIPYPMDLRGIAETSPTVRYIAGGMEANQLVSKKLLKLTYKQIPLGVNDFKSPLSFDIYPNPANEGFTIQMMYGQLYDFNLYSVTGELQISRTGLKGSQEISTDYLERGFYIAEVFQNGKKWHQKLLLQ